MLEINLWDNTFSHLATANGRFSMVHKKIPENIKYVCRKTKYDGVTIFTDHFLNAMYIKSVRSKHKIGWYIERSEINSIPKITIDNYIQHLDFLMTNDSDLLERYPNKTKFVPFGGTWILDKNHGVHRKNKMFSMVYSNKKNTYKGYNLRHEVASKFSEIVDLYGNGSNRPVKLKEHAIQDYRYTIVIENLNRKNYFTEKLVDAFVLGTIPIYWGCPNIND